MAGWQVNPFVLPDFGASVAEGRQAQQAQQQNALMMAMRQREYDNGLKFENALQNPAVLAGMSSPDTAMQQQAYSILAQQGGPQGMQAALPLITQTRQQAGLQNAMQSVFGNGGAQPQAMPQAQPRPMPSGAPMQAPANLAPILQRASAESGVPVPLILATLKQESSMGQDPRANANGGGPMQIIGSTARDPGYGLPPLSDADRLNPEVAIPWAAKYLAARGKAAGVTDWSDPAQRARGFTAYNGGGDPNYAQNVERQMGGGGGDAPAGRPQMGGRIPTTAQLFSLMATGNPQAMELASKLAPLVAQANPNMTKVELGGRTYMVNPQDPSQRIDMGPTDSVRPETRTVNGMPVQGETVNGKWTAYANPLPAGKQMVNGRLEDIPGNNSDEKAKEGFTQSRQLREEVNTLTKDFRIIQTAHSALTDVARDPSPAGDLSLLYQFNKMLDPNSVVRESEFATAAATGAVDQRVGAAVLKLLNGERLTETQRADFVRQADLLYTSQRRGYDQITSQYGAIAKRAGLPVEQVIVDQIPPRQEAAPAPAPAGTPPAALPRVSSVADAMKLKPGQRFIDPNGQERIR